MSQAVDVAVHPQAIGPNGTHPTLILWSDGHITASNGAGVPPKSNFDDVNPPSPSTGGWSSPRYNPLVSPTVGRPKGEIANKIIVFETGGWSDLNDIKGYVLDGWGQVIPFGSTTTKPLNNPYWGPPFGLPGAMGTDVARDMACNSTGSAVYVLDYSGGVHPCGQAPPPPMAAGPAWPGNDIARALCLHPNFFAGLGPHGWVLDAYGACHRVSVNISDPWLAQTTHGGGYWSGWDIARDLVYNFTTDTGYLLNGWGDAWIIGTNHPEFGPAGQGGTAAGSPRTPGADLWSSLSWPDVSQPFFVSLNRSGAAHPWNLFVNPVNTITFPGATLTNTSRPSFAFKYGPWVAPLPGALSQIVAFLYPRAVRNGATFQPHQAVGSIWTYWRSGITGWEPQDAVFTLPPATQFVINNQVLEDLPNGADYNLFILTVSSQGLTSAWTEQAFTTNYSGQGAPSLTAVGQPDNLTGRRVKLDASGGGSGSVYEYQFSDDTLTWLTVLAGGAVAPGTSVYDYEAPVGEPRFYRAFRYTPSPFLRTAPSATQSVTLGMPAAGTSWRFIKLDGSTPVTLKAAAWRKTLRQPNEIHDPPGSLRASVTSAGYRGVAGTLECWVLTKAAHDELAALFETPKVLLLQGLNEQWYVWPGEVEAEFIRAAKLNTGPDSVFSVRFAYKFTIPLTEVTRPGLT